MADVTISRRVRDAITALVETANNRRDGEPAAEIVQEWLHYEVDRAVNRDYNPDIANATPCRCGHPYYRHFDPCEDRAPVGCKYCGCREFMWSHPELPRAGALRDDERSQADGG